MAAPYDNAPPLEIACRTLSLITTASARGRGVSNLSAGERNPGVDQHEVDWSFKSASVAIASPSRSSIKTSSPASAQ